MGSRFVSRIARQNTGHSVTFQFQINNKKYFSESISQILHGTDL